MTSHRQGTLAPGNEFSHGNLIILDGLKRSLQGATRKNKSQLEQTTAQIEWPGVYSYKEEEELYFPRITLCSKNWSTCGPPLQIPEYTRNKLLSKQIRGILQAGLVTFSRTFQGSCEPWEESSSDCDEKIKLISPLGPTTAQIQLPAVYSYACPIFFPLVIQLNPAISNSVISNRIGFPLDLPLFFQSFTMAYLELGYLEHSAISNCFFLPLAQINPGYLKLCYVPKKNWSTSVSQIVQSRHLLTRCTESWKMYWRVPGNESKAKLTGLAAANAEGDKLPIFVNFRDQTITPEIRRQPPCLEPPLSRTISR